jgi:hypothetical protein
MDRNSDDRRVELKLMGIAADLVDQIPKWGIVKPHKSDGGECWWKLRSDLAANETWDVAIARLIDSLGGEAAVFSLIERLNPASGTVVIYVPFNSPYQEQNGITPAVVQLLGRLSLSIDVIPLDFDPRNPTHPASDYD